MKSIKVIINKLFSLLGGDKYYDKAPRFLIWFILIFGILWSIAVVISALIQFNISTLLILLIIPPFLILMRLILFIVAKVNGWY